MKFGHVQIMASSEISLIFKSFNRKNSYYYYNQFSKVRMNMKITKLSKLGVYTSVSNDNFIQLPMKI